MKGIFTLVVAALVALLLQGSNAVDVARRSRFSRGAEGETKRGYCKLNEAKKGVSKIVDRNFRIRGSLVVVEQNDHITKGKGPIKVRIWQEGLSDQIRDVDGKLHAALLSGRFDEMDCKIRGNVVMDKIADDMDIYRPDVFQVRQKVHNAQNSLYNKRLGNGVNSGLVSGLYVALFRNSMTQDEIFSCCKLQVVTEKSFYRFMNVMPYIQDD